MIELWMAVPLAIPPVALALILYLIPKVDTEWHGFLTLAAMPALAFTGLEIAVGLIYLTNLLVMHSMGV